MRQKIYYKVIIKIKKYFAYDFKEEKEFDYSKLNNEELIKHIENLLQGKNNKLENQELYIKELFD